MSVRRDVFIWLDDLITSCDQYVGMPVRQVLGFSMMRGCTRKEIKAAKKSLGVMSIYDGIEWYWRYPFEH